MKRTDPSTGISPASVDLFIAVLGALGLAAMIAVIPECEAEYRESQRQGWFDSAGD